MKRKGWLIAAALLLAAAAALMFYGEKPAPPPPKAEVSFPRHLRQPELQRMEQRRVLPAPPPPPAPKAAQAPAPGPVRPRDPVLAALTASAKQSAVVIEANAIRYSPVGQMLIDCLANSPDGNNPIEEIKKRAGIDVLQDLDRVAVMDEGLVVSGNFGKAKWKELMGQEGMQSTSYGDKATLYERPPRVDKDGTPLPQREYFVTWGDQMIFVADSVESAHAVVDQLEGRAPPRPALLTEDQTYGEIYGVLSAKDLSAMLLPDQAKLADQLRSAAERIELHVDTSKDVGLVADVKGPDPSQVEDLGKSLGAALAMARLQAQANGEKDVADLLDLAHVRPDGNRFKMEMAMPLAMLEKQLAVCRNRKGGAQAPASPAKP